MAVDPSKGIGRTSRPDVVFGVVWGSQLVSVMGSGAASIALSLWGYEQTGRATDLALVFAAKFAVGIFCAPLAGAMIDHFGRRMP